MAAMVYTTIESPRPTRLFPMHTWAYDISDMSSSPPPYESLDKYPTHPDTPLDEPPRRRDPSPPQSYVRSPNIAAARRATGVLSIPSLREALNTLDSTVASLLSERDQLECRLEQAVRLQSPVQRLPNELLANIFIMGVLDTETEQEDSLLLANVMLVCKHWKNVAITTPVLWSRIMTGTRHSLTRAQRKLERSGSVPLHICADFTPRFENCPVATESIMHAMDLLRTAIWRWKSFRLIVPNRPQAYAALRDCEERAPFLESLSIQILQSINEEPLSLPPPLFKGHTPNLKSISFNSFFFNWDMKLLTGLRVLKLGGYWNGCAPSVDKILAMLRGCPQLEELVLRNMSDVDPDACSLHDSDPSEQNEFRERLIRVTDSRMIRLPRLVKASFHNCGIIRTRTILSLMTFPALQTIEFGFLGNVSPAIEHLRRQSLTVLPLHRLRIEQCLFSELGLIRLLRRLQSLSTLELVEVEDVSSHLLMSLSKPPSGEAWLCPKLTHLSLEGCTTLGWEGVRYLVEARLPAHCKAYPRQSSTSSSASSTASAASAASAFSVAEARRQFQLLPKSTSSASAFAATAHLVRAPAAPKPIVSYSLGSPVRLQSIDVTRCHQISKEMMSWLKMYVEDVKCEPAVGVWGEPCQS